MTEVEEHERPLPWFRFFHDDLDNPKLRALDPALRCHWLDCLCVAARCNGVLPPAAEQSFMQRSTEVTAIERLNDALMAAGLLLEQNGRLAPHDWHVRRLPSDRSRDRTRRYREQKKKRDGHGDSHGDAQNRAEETRAEETRNSERYSAEGKGREIPPSAASVTVRPTVIPGDFFLEGRDVIGQQEGALLSDLLNKRCHGIVGDAIALLHKAKQEDDPRAFIACEVYGGAGTG